MADCTHDCSTCGANCGERTAPQSFLEKQNEVSDIKRIIGIVSGKGGVGKSMVTSLIASAVRRTGKSVAILDADITGPSIPKGYGLKGSAQSDGTYLYPVETSDGIKVMSMNLLLPNDTDPVVWRGPVIAGAVKQFYTDVNWGAVDFMFVDMPPGTGDVPLTVFQSLPLNGIIVVTTPQDLVGMVVEKAVKMADLMDIPVLSVVENMSYYKCPDCGGTHELFGVSHAEEISERLATGVYSRLPLVPENARLADAGRLHEALVPELSETVERILKMAE